MSLFPFILLWMNKNLETDFRLQTCFILLLKTRHIVHELHTSEDFGSAGFKSRNLVTCPGVWHRECVIHFGWRKK